MVLANRYAFFTLWISGKNASVTLLRGPSHLEQEEEQHCSLCFCCGTDRKSGCPLKSSQFTTIEGCPDCTLQCLEMKRIDCSLTASLSAE